jgi:ribosomal protein S18 acetylase RimI-like enzyme
MDTYDTIEVREARPEDVGAIRRIARSSLETLEPQALSQETISEAVARWYGNDRFQYRLEEPELVVLVSQSGTELTGFSEAVLEADGTVGSITWLHVDPYHRGHGVGSELLAATEAALLGEGVLRTESRVLADNATGAEFARARGYRETGTRTIEIAGRTVSERRFVAFPDHETIDGVLEPVLDDGETRFVALDERERGSVAPFYAVYRDPDRDVRYGFCCGNCDSLSIEMNTMGTIACSECGNRRTATRWDAAYI